MLLDENGSTESERAAQAFAVFSLLGFFTYCTMKLLMFSTIKQGETDESLHELKRYIWRSTEKLQDLCDTLMIQQEDCQQDLRILQERLDKFSNSTYS